MAKIIFRCARDSKEDPYFPKKIDALSQRLTPDNITPKPPFIIQDGSVSIGIFNPNSCLPVKNTSVCMGNLIQPGKDWWKPHAGVPDGTYALFRSDSNTVELLTDMFSTRSIWYIHTDKEFLASTSQRAILFFLQEFNPNRDVYAWMLSSGTLGPGLSWDSRIQYLPGNARLVLDRESWKTAIHQEPVTFDPIEKTEEEHADQIKTALAHVFDNLDVDYSKWALSLSGGLDSRAILLFLKDRKNLKCITWGLKESMKDKVNDAFIAKSLADHYNIEHEFYETDISDEPIDLLINRFLIAGEGRSDNIAGYMDGFKIWKRLYESGYHGILRGDEAFGNRPISWRRDIYKNVELLILYDYENLGPISGVVEDFDQGIPPFLKKKDAETQEGWRDRLNAQYEIPVIFAALNDIKLPFVEIVNPFLSHSITKKVRRLPDDLRTDKFLFRKIVHSMSPDIPFAKHRAIAMQSDLLKIQENVDFMLDEIDSEYAKGLFPGELIQFICQNTKISTAKIKAKPTILFRLLRDILPWSIKRVGWKKIIRLKIDINTLALRACLISKMRRILAEDANTLSRII